MAGQIRREATLLADPSSEIDGMFVFVTLSFPKNPDNTKDKNQRKLNSPR